MLLKAFQLIGKGSLERWRSTTGLLARLSDDLPRSG
jgi:hypothetical protein